MVAHFRCVGRYRYCLANPNLNFSLVITCPTLQIVAPNKPRRTSNVFHDTTCDHAYMVSCPYLSRKISLHRPRNWSLPILALRF